jgi:aminoglycoside phosphotransferase (APT) family kinase protein
MERAAGEPTPPTFPSEADPAQRERAARDFVDILARIHRLDWKKAGLDFLPGPGNARLAARTQLEEWRHLYDKERLAHEPLLDLAFRRLEETLPSSDRVTLVHADFRSGNYLIDETGHITAMLDWEMAHLDVRLSPVCVLSWRPLRPRACRLRSRSWQYDDFSPAAFPPHRESV